MKKLSIARIHGYGTVRYNSIGIHTPERIYLDIHGIVADIISKECGDQWNWAWVHEYGIENQPVVLYFWYISTNGQAVCNRITRALKSAVGKRVAWLDAQECDLNNPCNIAEAWRALTAPDFSIIFEMLYGRTAESAGPHYVAEKESRFKDRFDNLYRTLDLRSQRLFTNRIMQWLENLEKEVSEGNSPWPVEGTDRLEEARRNWEKFGDIPIDKHDNITLQFLNFSPGTYRFDIWHWFEEHYDISIATDLLRWGNDEEGVP